MLAENLCNSYSSEFGIDTCILRLTQTFGPGVEYHDGRVFAEFARCIVENRNITLKTQGKTKRSYLYTTDAVSAILKVISSDKHGCEIYNVSNEETYCSIYEIALMLVDLFENKKLCVKIEEQDISELGYAPTLKINMDTNKITQMIRIAKMHYELNRTQLEIAKKEGISKATVSRILKSAMDKGIIEVRIKDSILNDTALEKDLIDAYPIKRAVIVPDLVENEQILLQDVCAALIDDLPRYVKNDSVIGVFYGHTLTALTRQLPKIKRKGVSVIQLAGGFSRAVYESNSLSILRSFADCFGGTAYQIPAPAMVEKPFIVEALKQDSQIAKVCDMAEICETAIFSVGNLERPSILYEMGLITSIEYQDMIHRGAIGDCCSHFLNKNGDVFDETMDARVVGPSLETIKKIPNKMLVVSGKKKAAVIHAALKGGLADSLYIDAPTAEELLKKQF